ncbi:MAG: 50S ribosomal protein L21 [Planctomycetota bacterium]
MDAIIRDGGRQYRVAEGDVLMLDYRPAEAGQKLVLGDVLAVGAKIGTPTVAGAAVEAEVLGACQGDKVYIQKFRRRKNYRRRTGHRQDYVRVKITAIRGA